MAPENEDEIYSWLRNAVKFNPITSPMYWAGRGARGIADYAKRNPGLIDSMTQAVAGSQMGPVPRADSWVAPASPGPAPTKTEPGAAMPAMRAAAPAQEPMAQAGPPATGFIDQGPPVPEEQKPHIRFGWGGNKPQDYNPGQTDLLSLPGAPAARTGFMQSGWVPEGNGPGASYTEGPGGTMRQTWNPASAPVQPGVAPIASGGGFSPSARWEDLGPQKLNDPAYLQSLAAQAAELEAQQREDEATAKSAEARMAAQDPLWREKGVIQAQLEGQRALLQEEGGIAQTIQKDNIDRWVKSAQQQQVADLVKSPAYLAADPTTREAMQKDAEAVAESMVWEKLASARSLGAPRLGGGSTFRTR